jgi:integrase
MSEVDSTQEPAPNKSAKRPGSKPAKPYPDFPLYAHATGQWAKKIRGRFYYFGPWTDPDAALTKYLDEKDALHAGRTPRGDPEAMTVKDACNHFINHKDALLDAGELSPRTWTGYKRTTDLLVKKFGKARLVEDLGPEDFAALRRWMAKRWGPYRLGDTVQIVRSVFKHAYDNGLIDRPVRFGPAFKKPSKKSIRLHRAKQGQKLFTADEIHQILDAAGPQLKAMILLGINCGFGNSDIGNLPLSALDLDGRWANFPRPKTGVERRCPLWPETVAAIKEAIAQRPAPKKKEHAGLVFVTKYGDSWGKDIDDSPITKEMRKLLDRLSINGHRNFYCLRHGFETIGGQAKDQVAVNHIMGHADQSMAAVYRERIDDSRLQAVSDYVRRWLFAEDGQDEKPDVVPFAQQVV